MNSIIKRFFGLLIALLSAASLLISLYMMMQVWKSKGMVADNLLSNASDAGKFLEDTSQTLSELDTISSKASRYISTTQSSLLTLAQSTHDTSILLTPVISLTGETLPDLITSTQNSLDSTKDTARLIDGIMNAISKIPLLNQSYNPEKSLAASLEQVSADLNRFDPQLLAMESGLQQSQSNLEVMEKEVTDFAQSLDSTIEEINQINAIIKKYQNNVKKLQDGLAAFEQRIPQIVTTVAISIIFFLVWLAVFQVYMVYKGLEILTTRNSTV